MCVSVRALHVCDCAFACSPIRKHGSQTISEHYDLVLWHYYVGDNRFVDFHSARFYSQRIIFAFVFLKILL